MKPYQNRKYPKKKSKSEKVLYEYHPERLLQFITLSAAAWSSISFLFGIGFILRIDPSLVQILSISDIFGISLSYIVYLVPLGVFLAAAPWQFFMPLPNDDNKSKMGIRFIPFQVFGRARKPIYYILVMFVGVSVPLIMLADYLLHFLDRSSLFFVVSDTLVSPVLLTLSILIIMWDTISSQYQKARFLTLLVLSLAASVAFLGGDYMSSLRMNAPSTLDCAVLSGSGGKCTPILILGSSNFITWQHSRMRVIPVGRIDHIWLHPHQKSEARRLP